jgi:hypothetical protein
MLVTPFQPTLMFAHKVRSLPESGVLKRCFTRVGSSLTHKHYIRLEKPIRDKHSSLLRTLLNYSRKKFITLCPAIIFIKLFALSLSLRENKLERLSLASLFNLVQYLLVRQVTLLDQMLHSSNI